MFLLSLMRGIVHYLKTQLTQKPSKAKNTLPITKSMNHEEFQLLIDKKTAV
jgi:hypothetical protein